MAYADRVQETTATVGTGTLTLGGAVSGFRTFASAFTNGTLVRYSISGGTEWETGEGIYTGGTLSRLNIFSSSNGNALVNLSAIGGHAVWCDLPAPLIADIGLAYAFAQRLVPQ